MSHYKYRNWMSNCERSAYEIGFEDGKAQIHSIIPKVFFFLLLMFCIISGSIAITHKCKDDTNVHNRYNRLTNFESDGKDSRTMESQTSSRSSYDIVASDPEVKDLPASEWFADDGSFILRNVKIGKFRYRKSFFRTSFEGFDVSVANDEVVIRNGQEIKLAKVGKKIQFNDVIQFTFLNEKYYVATSSSSLVNIICWKQNQVAPISMPNCDVRGGFPTSLFWAKASFYDKITYGKVKFDPYPHFFEVYRNSDNIICLKFVRIDQ